MNISLKGKICLITGGTHGIDYVTVKLFSDLGGRVIALGRNIPYIS